MKCKCEGWKETTLFDDERGKHYIVCNVCFKFKRWESD